MDKLPYIEVGTPVFLGDGADAFGAVRDIVPDGRPVLVVNIEGAGDLEVPLDAVKKVASKKVILDYAMLDEVVHQAIQHSLDKEDFPPEGEGEVELVRSYEDEESDEEVARADAEDAAISRPRGGR